MLETPIITDLPRLVAELPAEARQRFERIFHLSTTTGHLEPPRLMRPWIENYFGSVEAVTTQRIVKVTNVVTWEGALFNDLRARRPMEVRDHRDIQQVIAHNGGGPFGAPLDGTPADVFGRVEGNHSITASNIAKYDGFHGLVIFQEHDPLQFGRSELSDYLDTALTWAQKAHETDPEARYFFFMWNCLWKSGASIIHGHAQMTLTRDMHYAKVEALRRAMLSYRQQHDRNYFDDLYEVHQDLGLTFGQDEVRGLAYLTPVKEKEVLLMADDLNDNVKDELYHVLCTFTQRMDVLSFNLVLYMPPLGEVEGEDWSDFPVMVRIVDRGNLGDKVADFGGMELYAQSVIGTDPYFVARTLRETQC
jgi:hypothetical protein